MTDETQTTNTIKTTNSRRWFRFRLRTLLIMVTVLSVTLGWVGWELDQRRREKSTIAWVKEMGGQVYFHSLDENDERSWWEKTKDKWLGERVLVVDLLNKPVSDVSLLAELTSLRTIALNGTKVSDLSPLAELKNLEYLSLSATQVNDQSPLAENSQVSDEQVEELRLALPNCKIDF